MARLATVAWIALLLYLAFQSRLPELPVGTQSSTSPWAHFGTHLVLAVLVYLATGSRPMSLVKRAAVAGFAFAFSTALGLGLEATQSILPDRSGQISDLLLDIGGAAVGAALGLTLDLLKLNRSFLGVTALGLTLLMVVITGVSQVIWDPSLPQIGDHWHASYQISICGKELAPLPDKPGGVHTHGRGVIHIHPISRTESGKNATLALFFSTSGGLLTRDSMTLPSGETYANGDRCPGGQPGHLVVTVNGARLDTPSSYILHDREPIWIGFQPARETSK